MFAAYTSLNPEVLCFPALLKMVLRVEIDLISKPF